MGIDWFEYYLLTNEMKNVTDRVKILENEVEELKVEVENLKKTGKSR